MKKAIVGVLIIAISTHALADPGRELAVNSKQRLGEIIAAMEEGENTDKGSAALWDALARNEISKADLDTYLEATVPPNSVADLKKAIQEQNFALLGDVLGKSQRASFAGSSSACSTTIEILLGGMLTVAGVAIFYSLITNRVNAQDRNQVTSTTAYYNTQAGILNQLKNDPKFGPNHAATQQQEAVVRNAYNDMTHATSNLSEEQDRYERGKKALALGLVVGGVAIASALGCGLKVHF